MYLLSAPNSYLTGDIEARAYLDVNPSNNYSVFNDNGIDAPDYIRTYFSKVRILIFKNK